MNEAIYLTLIFMQGFLRDKAKAFNIQARACDTLRERQIVV